MAIDPEKFQKLQDRLDDIADAAPVEDENSRKAMEMVLGDALDEVEELIDESRPPRLYVFGRSGAGKSSLINALSNQEVAETGAVAPQTVDSELYHISASDRYASWDVVDSRGLFESVPPEGGVPTDTVEFLKEDLREYRPDMLIHVMKPGHARAGERDFEVLNELQEEFGELFPPVVYCLNHVDTHLTPGGEWPPENNPSLAGDIKETLDFVTGVLEEKQDTELQKTPLDENQPLTGYKFDSDDHVGIVPVCLKEGARWNVDPLNRLISDFLPDSARLQYAQLQQRQDIMRDLSRDVTNKFAGAATGIGALPVPVGDVAVLLPLQYLLIVIIGGFSCQEMKVETGKEYLGAMGGTTIGGLAARSMARSLLQFVPIAGTAISASVAGGGTWAMGRSAEAYFFDDEVIEPSSLREEGKGRFQEENED
jgi:uncharacterized protein (DUF697 family)/GTPase SAR1 family protein